MFEKGDYIVYGNSGVCEVMNIGPMEMTGVKKGKLYYTLRQVYSDGGTIFTPIDNEKIVMRTVFQKAEVLSLLDTIPFIEPLEIDEEKKREERYKDVLKACDFQKLMSLIKLILFRKKTREEMGKKMASLDERYLKMAEEALYEELEISLSSSREAVAKIVEEKLEEEGIPAEILRVS